MVSAAESGLTFSPNDGVRRRERQRSSRGLDDYDDVVQMFEVLGAVAKDGDRDAEARQREVIFMRCLGLADRIARHYCGRGEVFEDLVQAARLGLVKAVNGFDPTRGSPFVAFAIPTMMGEVRRHFRDHGWSMHVPRRLKDRHQHLAQATTEMTQSLGRAPTAGELASHLDLSREDVVESLLAAASYRVHSTDVPVSGGGSALQMFADTVGDVDAAFDLIIDRETVRPLLAALPDRQRTVLYLRFFESLTQSQIAERLGISQMHVSRMLERTLRQLRDQI